MAANPDCPPCEEGAPAWMLTYGDMVTLILCFFVLLFTITEISSAKFARVLGSIRNALGEGYNIPTFEDPIKTQDYFEKIILRSPLRKPDEGEATPTKGDLTQKDTEVPGKSADVVGVVRFEIFKVALSTEVRTTLRTLVNDRLRANNNRVTIAGHVSPYEADLTQWQSPRSLLADLWSAEKQAFVTTSIDCRTSRDLSYWRARAVMEFLLYDPEIRRMLVASPDGLGERTFELRALDQFDPPPVQQQGGVVTPGNAQRVEIIRSTVMVATPGQ